MKYQVLAAIVLVGLIGCSKAVQQGETQTVVVRETVNELEKETVPGTVNEVWVEPMTSIIDVPGAIDPKGVYYRAPHRTIVEIRPYKFQKVQYPDFNGKYPAPESR
ncbi:MAG TPA: hypothetical protein PLP17_02360 [Oligoflexia bacterium]|nr:hypothetical protein [Oligoflexia bacterium]